MYYCGWVFWEEDGKKTHEVDMDSEGEIGDWCKQTAEELREHGQINWRIYTATRAYDEIAMDGRLDDVDTEFDAENEGLMFCSWDGESEY